ITDHRSLITDYMANLLLASPFFNIAQNCDMKYDVYGIGNALVDIVTEVDHGFFEKNLIEKGVMTLVDEKRQLELMKVIDMKRSKMSCGGSAGNTMIAVNQFGGKSYYSCLVAHDELGKFF